MEANDLKLFRRMFNYYSYANSIVINVYYMSIINQALSVFCHLMWNVNAFVVEKSDADKHANIKNTQ